MIKRFIPWYIQPQYPVSINWGNPLTLGLEFVHNTAIKGFEAKTGKLCTYAGSIIWNAEGFSATGAAGSYIQSQSTARLGGLNNSTVFTLSRTAATTASSGTQEQITAGGNALYAERGSSGNDIYKIGWCYSSAGELPNTLAVEFTYRNDAGTLLQKRISASGLNNNALIASAIVKNGTTHYVYVDGRIDSGTFGSGSTAFTDASVESLIGSDKADSLSPWNGTIPIVIGWSRSLSKAELDSLRQNPWQILAPQQRNIYVSASGGLTLNPSAGEIVTLGTPPAIAQPRTVTPDYGVIACVGNAPAIVQSITIAPATGAAVITGNAPVISQPRTVSPAAGDVALAGSAPTISQSRTVAPDAGETTFLGFAPTIIRGVSLSPDAGAVVIAGFAPSISQSTGIAPSAGAIDFTGYAPTLLQARTVALGVGAAIYTGLAPAITQTATLSPGAGSIIYAGIAPTILQPRTLAIDSGSSVFEGFAPVITQGRTIAPDVGAIIFSGNAPVISQPRTIAPVAGAVTFYGYAPSLGLSDWAGEPFNFASPITRTFGFTSGITKNLNFESPI